MELVALALGVFHRRVTLVLGFQQLVQLGLGRAQDGLELGLALGGLELGLGLALGGLELGLGLLDIGLGLSDELFEPLGGGE